MRLVVNAVNVIMNIRIDTNVNIIDIRINIIVINVIIIIAVVLVVVRRIIVMILENCSISRQT